jgi:hypothetical protein
LSARYRITVDRDVLDKTKPGADPKHQARPIRVEDTSTGTITHGRDVSFPLGARIVYGDPQQDGARVWIEAEGIVPRA